MARIAKKRKPLTVEDLRGCKPLQKVGELLSALHDVGCARDQSGNRELHFNDYVMPASCWR